ncbi:MAG: glutamate--tRNA ligase [Candidatus Paceibacterota bacterium]
MSNNIRTRIAPSPTGWLHIGTARTALFNYLFTKQNKGQFILRIEDTDKTRSKKEYEDNIIEALSWLGLCYDEKYRQSERLDIYQKYLKKIIDTGQAYTSKEQATDGSGEVEVIRFKNPNQKITFTDLIRGDITFDTTDLGDFVIAKDMSTPLYHLAVVVDDYEMNITHVIRGEDHISNTPRQLLIAKAIGAPTPIYAHIPLILAPDRSKLSKRHGAVAITEYKNQGYTAEAMINFMALLGWSPQAGPHATNEEIFNLNQLIKKFNLETVNNSGAIFNVEKLNWLNKEHLKLMPSLDLITEIKKHLPNITTLTPNQQTSLVNIILEKIYTWSDLTDLVAAGNFDYFFTPPVITDKTKLKTRDYLEDTIKILEDLDPNNFTAPEIKTALWDFATAKGRGNVLWPLRYALTGQDKSPDPFVVAEILGQTETITRLKTANSL